MLQGTLERAVGSVDGDEGQGFGYLKPLKLVQQLFMFGWNETTPYLLLQSYEPVRQALSRQVLNKRLIKYSA